MSVERASDEQLLALGSLIDGWAASEQERNPLLSAVDSDRQLKRWYLRMRGEEKAVITVWLTLGERTLQYETYFMPAPEENIEACLKYLLRANNKLFAMRFTIGAEDAIYLAGQLPLSAIDEAELDRVVGSAYAYSEQHFGAAMSLGYASRFRRPAP